MKKNIYINVPILLMTLAAGSMAIAATAIQTDWSAGPGVSGPVTDWSNTFDSQVNINWYSISGQLNLDYTEPMEHVIWSTYTNVIDAWPIDLDGDGDEDIVASAGRYSPPYFFSGRIDWFENTDGTGLTWVRHDVDPDFTSAPKISAADLDEDGDIDVIGAARGTINHLAWWENVDSIGTTWAQHTIPSSLQDVSSIDTADVNGDGYIDILVTDASYNDVVWLKNADGSGMNWIEYNIDGSFNTPYDIFGADVDGDGHKDVVAAAFNGDDIYWWENADDSGTVWNEHVVSSNFNGARSVFAVDIDGDTDMDILGASSLDWSITWWENSDGYGNTWVEHFISGTFNYAFAVYAADVDQDGDNDVLGASYFGDDIMLWENTDGLGLTWYEHTIDGNFDGARDVATADMDGDNDPDILGAAVEDADISWWDVTCCVTAGELVSSILDTEMSADWDSIIWTADEPSGTSVYFQVRSSVDPQYMGDWSTDITIPSGLDAYLDDGDQYVQYKTFLETNDPGSTPTLWDITISWTPLGIEEDHTSNLLSDIKLLQNHPNPFYPATTIEFFLSKTCKVNLDIFNILGQEIANLYSGQLDAGYHSFKANFTDLPDGVYLYRLEAENYVQTKKMILLR